MAFQDTYRLSVHAVITNDEQQVARLYFSLLSGDTAVRC